jgi:hypothetical protein
MRELRSELGRNMKAKSQARCKIPEIPFVRAKCKLVVILANSSSNWPLLHLVLARVASAVRDHVIIKNILDLDFHCGIEEPFRLVKL